MSQLGVWLVVLALPFRFAAVWFAYALSRKTGTFKAWSLVMLGLLFLALTASWFAYSTLRAGNFSAADDLTGLLAISTSIAFAAGTYELDRTISRL